MNAHMMRVISSPSISTMGFSTLILDMRLRPVFLREVYRKRSTGRGPVPKPEAADRCGDAVSRGASGVWRVQFCQPVFEHLARARLGHAHPHGGAEQLFGG